MEKQEAFKRVLETLKNNKSMVEAREDGIYIRLAGTESKGEAFTLEWGKVFSLGEKSNTQSFAKQELDILAATVPDAVVTPFAKEILGLCEAFGKSGQSGGGAPFVAGAIAGALKSLLLQKSICPITGADDEWVNVMDASNDDEMMYQNRRCGGLFKSKAGRCWYIDAITLKGDKLGNTYGWAWPYKIDYLKRDKSRQIGPSHYVKSFPFTPKTFYIDVIDEQISKDNWVHFLKNPKQLDRVFRYYERMF